MKSPLIFILFIFPFYILSQTNPIDTSYYVNGSIRSILFKNDYKISGYLVEAFYEKSNCKKCIGKRITDSIYEHQPQWEVPQKTTDITKYLLRIVRKYYIDNIVREKGVIITGKVQYEKLTLDKNFLTISRNLKDSLIKNFYPKEEPLYHKILVKDFYLTIEDSVTHKNKKIFAYIDFNESKFPLIQEFQIDSGNYIEINAYENAAIKSIIFKNSQKIWNGRYIEFYPNDNLKEFGYYKMGNRTGIWYEWYENGALKAKGQYGKTQFGEVEQAIFLKNDVWIYYDETGKKTKEEKWKDGKLISSF